MNNKLIGLAIAGAMLAGIQTAEAQPQVPSSGNSDLWLFVSNQAGGNTLAVDTGVTVSSLVSAFTDNAVLQSVNDSFTKTATQLQGAATGVLSTYLGSSGLEYALVGMNYTGVANTSSVNRAAGADLGVLSASSASATQISQYQLSGLITWAAGFNKDMNYVINGNGGTQGAYTTGGEVISFANGTTVTGQVWGGNPGGVGVGSTTEYGTGPAQSGFAPGTSQTLYAITANGGTGQVQSYVLGQINLSSSGTLSLTQTPVPLPAAVWLFGSGLLGLAGIGRRRSAVAA
jgi:hypothetical protein